MTFIRSKEIPPGSGNWYDYEVKTVHEGSRVRQKVVRYLGRSDGSHVPQGADRDFGASRSIALSFPDAPSPVPPVDDARIPKMKTPARLIASAMGMYYGGMSLDAIQQQFKQEHNLDMSESNYWNWVKRFTKEAMRQLRRFKPKVGDTWVADETYMKLKGRNVYFWDIIDADTRYLLATHVSYTRSGRDAKALMDLAQKRAGRAPRVVVTDKLSSYVSGIEDAYGADSKHRQGGPFNVKNNTNLIERFHRTLEQRTRVFQKYKSLEDIRLLTGGWLVNYNFFKQHSGVGDIPPAQAMSKVVPCKDWNDVVRDTCLPDIDYKVSLYRRPSVKKGKVLDATLTPVVAKGESA